MVELLVVIVIMSILISIIVPSMTGSDVARVRTAARGVMQISRYARSMAVLHQQTLYLEIASDGKLRVTGGTDGGDSEAPSPQPQSSSPSIIKEGPSDSDGGRSSSGGSGGVRMSDVNTEKEYKQIHFHVELDEDALSDFEIEKGTGLERVELEAKEGEKEEKEHPFGVSGEMVKIPYESNGRCLPYRVTITPAAQSDNDDDETEPVADRAVLIVDRFGNVTVEDEEK